MLGAAPAGVAGGTGGAGGGEGEGQAETKEKGEHEVIYADANLPSLRTGKHNRGNTTRQRTWTPGQRAFGQGLGSHNLRGLGDGEGAIPWASDVLPCQLDADPHWDGTQRLCFAVLLDAVELIQGMSRRSLHERKEALRWVQSRECGYLFDFEHVCVVLGLDAEWVRAGLHEGRRAA